MRELFDYLRQEWRQLNRLERVTGSIIVTVLFVLFTSQWLYSAAISGTNLAAKVAPFDTADTYPTHDARYGKGGLVQVGYTTQRNAIPIQRRYSGTIVYVHETDMLYKLRNGTANTNWQPLSLTGYDGKTIPTLYCNLSGGSRSHNYDTAGLNPTPAPFAFKVRMYLNGIRTMLIKHFKWTTQPRGLVYGNSTSSAFTPSLHFSYSANRNNGVDVQAAYSTTASWGGKRWCGASTPIAITKTAVGLTGPPGADATVTNNAVFRAMTSTLYQNDMAFTFRPASPVKTTPKTIHRNYSGAVVNWIDGWGYQYFKDKNAVDWQMLTPTSNSFYKSNVLRTAFGYQYSLGYDSSANNRWFLSTSMINDAAYGIFSVRKNASTPVFIILSSGRYKPAHGWPSSNGQQELVNTDGSRYYAAPGSGGSGSPGGSNKQLQYNNNGAFAGAAFARYSVWASGLSGTLIITGGMVVK